MPRGRFRVPPVTHRPDKVDCGYQHSEAEYRCARAREHVEHLKLGRVSVITARHAEITGDELLQERQVEPDEDHERAETSPAFGIHAPADLGPPVMQPAEVTHQRAA